MWRAICACGEPVVCEREPDALGGFFLRLRYRSQCWMRAWNERINPTYAVTCEVDDVQRPLVFQPYIPPPLTFKDCSLGCDPEFAASLAGKRVNFAPLLTSTGALGYDHGGRVAEVRPAPAMNARTVVRHIRTILAGASGEVRAGKWKAGAIASNPNDALGGHIHVGVGIRTNEEYTKILKALDAFSTTLYALDILPAQENKRRQIFGYGAPGSVRRCWHSGVFCMEYRTMCSWLYDPKIALLAMAGAKIAAVEPEFTATLLAPEVASFRLLQSFFERFRYKVRDAAFITEKILTDKLIAQPDIDVQDAWELPAKPNLTRDVPFLDQIGLRNGLIVPQNVPPPAQPAAIVGELIGNLGSFWA